MLEVKLNKFDLNTYTKLDQHAELVLALILMIVFMRINLEDKTWMIS